jgi:hypothetical protein
VLLTCIVGSFGLAHVVLSLHQAPKQRRSMAILTSDNIVKLAFSLPLLPVLVLIAWKLGFVNWSPFPGPGGVQAYDPKTGLGRGVSSTYKASRLGKR